MKFIYVTDTHFRNTVPVNRTDDILDSLLNKWTWVCEYAAKVKADILHGGDLFHTPSVPDYVAQRVIKIIKKYEREVYFVIGNHDVSGANTSKYDYSKIGLMAEYPWFHLVGGKAIEFKECVLTGYDYSKEMDCPEVIDPLRNLKFETNGRPVICMIHSMLTDESPIIIDGKPKTINWASVNANVELILSGHYHPGWKGIRHHPFGPMFINPGAMIRQTAAKDDVYRKPKIVIIDVKDKKLDISFKVIPHRKDVFNEATLEAKSIADQERNRFIEALNAISDEDIAGGNVLKILDNIMNMKIDKDLITPKVLKMCRKKIEEFKDATT